jgi:hypothetical protein
MAEYNFNVQDPYAAQAADIARRQKMAEIMQAQALQPIEKFSYNGIEARISPYQGLAKMLQAYMGGRGQAAALEEQKALGEKYNTDLMSTLSKASELSIGKPETTVSTGPVAPELMTEQRMPFTTDKTIPAIKGNDYAAAQEYLKHPATRALGLASLQQDIKARRLANALIPEAAPTVAPAANAAPVMSNAAVQPQSNMPAAGGQPMAAPTPKVSATNPPPGVSPMAWRLALLSGDENEVQKLIQGGYTEANKPIQVRGGSTLLRGDQPPVFYPNVGTGQVYDKDTNTISNIPGAVNAQNQLTQGEYDIKEGNKIVELKMPDGTTRQMTQNQATQLLTGRNPNQPSVQPQIQPPPAQQTLPQQRVMPGAVNTQTAPTDAKAIQLAQALQMKNPNQPFSITVPPTQSTTSQPITTKSMISGFGAPSKATEEGNILRSKQFAEQEKVFQEQFGRANTTLSNLTLVEQLAVNPNVASGALAENISGLKSIGDSLGFATKGLPAEEAIKGITTQLALQAKNEGGTNLMPGAMALGETKLLQSMVPQLAQSKEGRMLMIQISKEKVARDRLISEMAGDYIDKNGQLDAGFQKQIREYSKNNPIFPPGKLAAMQALANKLLSGAK